MQLVRRRMIVEAYLQRNVLEDPSDEARWLASCHELLDQVRGRFSVRMVERR